MFKPSTFTAYPTAPNPFVLQQRFPPYSGGNNDSEKFKPLYYPSESLQDDTFGVTNQSQKIDSSPGAPLENDLFGFATAAFTQHRASHFPDRVGRSDDDYDKEEEEELGGVDYQDNNQTSGAVAETLPSNDNLVFGNSTPPKEPTLNGLDLKSTEIRGESSNVFTVVNNLKKRNRRR